MSTEEISAEYSRRYVELAGGAGRSCSVNTSGYWELENWYMREHQTLISSRVPVRAEPPVKAVNSTVQRMPAPPAPVKAPTSSGPRLCACGREIIKKPGRGRPPVRCATCRGI